MFKFDKIKLAQLPTPIEFLENISKEAVCDVWIKRDDISGKYGGNKVRKLEYLYSDVLKKNVNYLVIYGSYGSHHILANCIYSEVIRCKVVSVFFPQHPTQHVIENFKKSVRLCEKYYHSPNPISSLVKAFIVYLMLRAKGKKPYLVPPGSTSPLSSLGFVSAALELKDQIEREHIPKPDFIIIPAGTLGSCVGLAAGLSILKIDSQVLGISVVGKILANSITAGYLLKNLFKILGLKPQKTNLKIVSDFVGKGYGYETEDGEKAKRLFFNEEGITLDSTYTAKAASAIFNLPEIKNKKILFWHTLNSNKI